MNDTERSSLERTTAELAKTLKTYRDVLLEQYQVGWEWENRYIHLQHTLARTTELNASKVSCDDNLLYAIEVRNRETRDSIFIFTFQSGASLNDIKQVICAGGNIHGREENGKAQAQ